MYEKSGVGMVYSLVAAFTVPLASDCVDLRKGSSTQPTTGGSDRRHAIRSDGRRGRFGQRGLG
jgi:hypothetical protein